MIYFDNAATSYTHPEGVARAMVRALASANPGRSGHAASLRAGRVLLETREALARCFGTDDPFGYVFTANGTESLNLAIRAYVRRGDHVVVTVFEHNSVLRVLHALGADVVYAAPAENGFTVEADRFASLLTPETRLAVMTHVSNVTGALQPLEKVSAICHERGIVLLGDGAQAAGSTETDLARCAPMMYAFPGHKGLLGPTGTGALYIPPELDPEPLKYGGTGSASDELTQPAERPDRYESGTANVTGLAGLGAGVRFVTAHASEIRKRERLVTDTLYARLSAVPSVRLFSPPDSVNIVSFTVGSSDPAEIADRLWSDFGIAARSGLHCAPTAHDFLGTKRGGTVRLSVGAFNTVSEALAASDAVKYLARKYV